VGAILVAAACAALAACDDTTAGPAPRLDGAESARPTSSGSAAAPPRSELCDRYIEAMQACIAKLPEAERGPRSEALAATKRAWSETTGGAEARAQLETTCRAALTALEQTPCP
jgi:hypothetical protein